MGEGWREQRERLQKGGTQSCPVNAMVLEPSAKRFWRENKNTKGHPENMQDRTELLLGIWNKREYWKYHSNFGECLA